MTGADLSGAQAAAPISSRGLDSGLAACSCYVLFTESAVMTDFIAPDFIALGPHDGGLFRAPGTFRFVRRDAGGQAVVLVEEQASDIAARAGPTHPRWAWALDQGLNELHVRLELGRG